MTQSGGHRLRRIGWLLTPLVVWAASLVGAWVGALGARRFGGPRGGIGLMVAGAVGIHVRTGDLVVSRLDGSRLVAKTVSGDVRVGVASGPSDTTFRR